MTVLASTRTKPATSPGVASRSARGPRAGGSGGAGLQRAGRGTARAAQQIGQGITERELNRQPTIQVRAGWPLRVIVNKDMILAPY